MSGNRSIAFPDGSGTLMLEGTPIGSGGAVAVRGYYPPVVVTTSKILALSDAGTRQLCVNSSSISLTIPESAAAALPIGATIEVNRTDSIVSIVAMAGVSLEQDGFPIVGPVDVAQSVRLIKTATNTWILDLPGARPTAVIFVWAGESNTGGAVPVSSLPSWELVTTPWVQIWNNSTNVFESLKIGTNNLLGHAGFASNVNAGLEMGLRRSQAVLGVEQVFLLKCGQGGSTIAQWSVGNATGYWSSLVARYTAARAVLESRGFAVRPVFLWWMGLNDALALTPPATWQAANQTFFGNVRNLMGADLTIYQIRLQTNAPNAAERIALNAAITSMAASDSRFIPVDLPSGVEVSTDGAHFTKSGYISIFNAFIEAALSRRSLGEIVTRGRPPGPSGNHPRVVCICTTALTIANNATPGTGTIVPWDPTFSYDPDGLIDYATNTITIPSWAGGQYHCFAAGGFTIACTEIEVIITVDGTSWVGSPRTQEVANVILSNETSGTTLFLLGGSTVTMLIRQTNVTAQTRTLTTAPQLRRANLSLTRMSD